MRKRHYVMKPKDLYDVELWPHLNERLPEGVKKLLGVETEPEAMEIAANILDDYMSMAFDEMVSTGDMWILPCFKTGYIYIKDQKLHYDQEYYKYDIDLDGAFYRPVFIMDRSIMNKACGFYNIIIPLYQLRKIKKNAKSGIQYNASTGR